jgi:DNA-binding protein YbaB
MEAKDLGSSAGPEHARERLAQWQGQLDRIVIDTRAMHDRIHGMRVTMSDRNKLVTVTVDYTGALVDLDLSERTRRTAPQVVADTIMATIGAAKARVAEEADEIIAQTLGTKSAAARTIRDGIRQQLDQIPPGHVPADRRQ